MSATPIPDPVPDDAGSHYFEDPSVESDPVMVDVTLPDTAFTMETDTGVFSRGHLDAGTSLLLRSDATLASSGHLLDLGAGSGAMAITMARRSPEATVWALDVNARARDLCRRNAARNNLTNIRVVAPDEVPDRPAFFDDLVEPADSHRQTGAARVAAHLVGTVDRRRHGDIGGPEASRCGLAAAVADLRGAPDRARGVEIGVPTALGAAGAHSTHVSGAVGSAV